jgi:succinate dehydrogenase/fumarate reductase flavoprotein subunit
MSKTTTVVLIGLGVAAVGAAVYVASRPRRVAAPSGATFGGAFGTAIANYIPTAAGKIFDYFSASNSKPDTTAVSNYIADATAASDSASGVVGFGGWD